MTSSTFSGWIGCLTAGAASLFFLSADPHSGKAPGVRPTLLQAAVSRSDSNAAAVKSDDTNSAETILREKVQLLERGRDFLLHKPGYTTRFQKQEVVEGELRDEQTIAMKCRHEPFSVYLAWQTGDVGREVLYVEGENNGRLLAHDGGWKARLPAISLTPDCNLAMRDARYPVTDAGLVGLVDIMLTTHKHDLEQSSFTSCAVQKRNGPNNRPGSEFTTYYKSAAHSPVYRKSITLIDDEWNIPLETHHFTWPAGDINQPEASMDAATLIESYRFEDLDFTYHPQAEDFDRSNAEYHF